MWRTSQQQIRERIPCSPIRGRFSSTYDLIICPPYHDSLHEVPPYHPERNLLVYRNSWSSFLGHLSYNHGWFTHDPFTWISTTCPRNTSTSLQRSERPQLCRESFIQSSLLWNDKNVPVRFRSIQFTRHRYSLCRLDDTDYRSCRVRKVELGSRMSPDSLISSGTPGSGPESPLSER